MNLFNQFKKLLPTQHLLVGEVVSHNADGTSTVNLPSGATIRARGQGVAVNDNAFVRDGEIAGQAPNLPVTNVTV